MRGTGIIFFALASIENCTQTIMYAHKYADISADLTTCSSILLLLPLYSDREIIRSLLTALKWTNWSAAMLRHKMNADFASTLWGRLVIAPNYANCNWRLADKDHMHVSNSHVQTVHHQVIALWINAWKNTSSSHWTTRVRPWNSKRTNHGNIQLKQKRCSVGTDQRWKMNNEASAHF